MTGAPIAWCVDCGKALCSPKEFLILVPLVALGTKGDVDIGDFDAFCESCYCAMGVSGGRKRWNDAMRNPRQGQWVHDGITVHQNPSIAAMWNGWHYEPGEEFEQFPGDLSFTYFDRKTITMFVFNKLGRCVMHIATPSQSHTKSKGRNS